ncbi:MAG: FAD binding domain-containing protein [Chloroflexi bacterium]|nr:FAD binding domain-containing protein [Chloroflexota bacterium]
MTDRIREYHRPSAVADALALLKRSTVRTVPIASAPRVPAEPYAGAQAVVDLSQLHLSYVAETGSAVRLGAHTSLQDLVTYPRFKTFAGGVLSQAAYLAAHPGLRQLATVGGALTAPDGPPEMLLALLALQAAVVTQGAELRETPLAGYVPADTELIVEVKFSLAATGGALARVGRTPLDAAIVAVVAVVDASGAGRAAVAGASAQPFVHQWAAGTKPEQIAEAVQARANPAADYRGSAEYRQAMAGVLARRAAEKAMMNDE